MSFWQFVTYTGLVLVCFYSLMVVVCHIYLSFHIELVQPKNDTDPWDAKLEGDAIFLESFLWPYWLVVVVKVWLAPRRTRRIMMKTHNLKKP